MSEYYIGRVSDNNEAVIYSSKDQAMMDIGHVSAQLFPGEYVQAVRNPLDLDYWSLLIFTPADTNFWVSNIILRDPEPEDIVEGTTVAMNFTDAEMNVIRVALDKLSAIDYRDYRSDLPPLIKRFNSNEEVETEARMVTLYSIGCGIDIGTMAVYPIIPGTSTFDYENGMVMDRDDADSEEWFEMMSDSDTDLWEAFKAAHDFRSGGQ